MATLAELQAELAAYKAAETAILTGAQSYTISGRSLTRGNLRDIQAKIAEIEARVDRKTRSDAGESMNVSSPVFVTTRGSTS